MEKLEYLIRIIENCDLCNGVGVQYWTHGEDYEFETCECNPYDLMLDEAGNVIYDNGLLSEGELFTTAEAL